MSDRRRGAARCARRRRQCGRLPHRTDRARPASSRSAARKSSPPPASTGRTSLLFLDVDEARDRLKTNPWIADATVLKLYPDRLQIGITEREAFALWQKDGQLSVIAADGTVLEPYAAPTLRCACRWWSATARARKAKEFLALLDRYPEICATQVRASILVAERRWNLRLKNGIDVRLPEAGVEPALEQLVALDRDKKLLSRDIVAIDLRLRGPRHRAAVRRRRPGAREAHEGQAARRKAAPHELPCTTA